MSISKPQQGGVRDSNRQENGIKWKDHNRDSKNYETVTDLIISTEETNIDIIETQARQLQRGNNLLTSKQQLSEKIGDPLVETWTSINSQTLLKP